jgi:hypothetical protein
VTYKPRYERPTNPRRGITWHSSSTALKYGYTEPSGVITVITRVRRLCHEADISDQVVSLDGSDPVIQSGMIRDPGTYQSVLYQATKLYVNTPHYIQVTNLPGKSRILPTLLIIRE